MRRFGRVVGERGYRPERVHPQNVHKVVGVDLAEQGVRADGAGVGEEDVESAVPLQSIVDHLLHRLLVGGVELPRVHVDLVPQAVDLALVRLEVAVIVVADVDGLGAVLRELMGGGSSDAQDGVCALAPVSFEMQSVNISGGDTYR